MPEIRDSESKKLTIFYLQRLFLEKTDKDHHVSMQDIIDYLASYDIFVKRRAIYSDIAILQRAGFEIKGKQERGNYKYYHTDHLFSTNELKFLIDSVGSSLFLTDKKASSLIKKIKTLGTSHAHKALDRHIVMGKRIPSMSDSVFENLDRINQAISENKKITFKYLRWNTNREPELFREGKPFIASPFAVTLSNDYYYLLSHDSRTDSIKHYRIDKMKTITTTTEEREGQETYTNFKISDFTLKIFNMYGGEEETITFEADNGLANVFIDRFGDSLTIIKNSGNPHTFIARARVYVSPQFFAWVFGLGDKVKITSPDRIKENFKKYLSKIAKLY